MVPYLDLPIRNGLAERTDAEIVRYQTTTKGAEALRHMQELERLMPENGKRGRWGGMTSTAREICKNYILIFDTIAACIKLLRRMGSWEPNGSFDGDRRQVLRVPECFS